MLRDAVTSLCNLHTEAISPSEYCFLTETTKQYKKKIITQKQCMEFNFSWICCPNNKFVEENGLTSKTN